MNDLRVSSPPIITLTTDFGPGSSYVGQMKGVIYSIHPEVTLVDAAHDIRAQDITQASFAWNQVSQHFPAGTIHLAVVDPGVGTDRRLLLVETEFHYLIAPDNGLLSQVLARQEPRKILTLDRPEYWRHPVSATFHGRDIMAPVAAHLSRGELPEQLGTPAHEPRILDLPPVLAGTGSLSGEVIYIDGFGNLITNIQRADWNAAGVPDDCHATCCGQQAVGLQHTYGNTNPGSATILFGSSDYLEFSLTNENAARKLAAGVTTPILLEWSS
ncbi:MAG: SAM-dependent chlorinase/fluorinase [Pirellulaceae bacterium]